MDRNRCQQWLLTAAHKAASACRRHSCLPWPCRVPKQSSSSHSAVPTHIGGSSHADSFRRNASSWQLANNTCRQSTQLSVTTTDPHHSLNFPMTFRSPTRALLSSLIASGFKTCLGFAPNVKHCIKKPLSPTLTPTLAELCCSSWCYCCS